MTFKMLSRIGNRTINEDAAICLQHGNDSCFVVADGLGGHQGGAIAAQKLIEVFEREFSSPSYSYGSAFLAHAFDSAQNEILSIQKTADKMRTTGVALNISPTTACWAHIGDSRLYHFRKAKLKHRTLDHSVPQMLVISRQIKDDDIPGHPDRNKLLRVIGDYSDSPRYELSLPLKLKNNDAFLLCSDGFWEFISTPHMELLLKNSSDADSWLLSMLDVVENNADPAQMDNYTAITVML